MCLRIVVEDDARIQQVARIEKPLDPTHQVDRLAPPFHLDEGRHVAPGAVFGLERSIVLLHNQLADVIHEPRVALDFSLRGEILRENEMEIAFERVAEDDRFVVSVRGEERLQIQGRCGKRLDRKGNVLDDDRGAGAPHGPHRREGALAHLPVHVAGLGIGGKFGFDHRGDVGKRLERRADPGV